MVLACDPWSMVFSESEPPLKALVSCDKCTAEQQQHLFHEILRLMSYSTYHKHLFFKFQSLSVTQMHIALEAFPFTPWVFLFRQPVQVLVSHMEGGGSAPCLRSRNSPTLRSEVNTYKITKDKQPSNIEWCAAHLHMLCNHAIDSFEKYSKSQGNRRGAVVDYSSLPGSLTKIIFPLFKYAPSTGIIHKITTVSGKYSKDRMTGLGGKSRKSGQFAGDSESKDRKASEEMRMFAESIMLQSFSRLAVLAEETAEAFLSEMDFRQLPLHPELPGRDWRGLSPLHTSSNIAYTIMKGVLDSFHSKVIPPVPAAQPFGNFHQSNTFETVTCPALPAQDYTRKYNMTTILSNWNPDNTVIPATHFDSLCHFNYSDPVQLQQAYDYREAEVPFVVYNVPEVDDVVRKWSNLDYVQEKLGIYVALKHYKSQVFQLRYSRISY